MDLSSGIWAGIEVVFINVVLSGDNAIVVAMAAAGAPAAIRSKVIFYGIGAAVVMRVILALLAAKFLGIVGLLFAGGLLLLWVCWKLYREIVAGNAEHDASESLSHLGEADMLGESSKTLGEAMWQILLADLSMSLDNVLAIAGAAREHPWIMTAGLILSVALMGLAATYIARLLDTHRWLAWVGLVVILYVAGAMIWEGGWEIEKALAVAVPLAPPPVPG